MLAGEFKDRVPTSSEETNELYVKMFSNVWVEVLDICTEIKILAYLPVIMILFQSVFICFSKFNKRITCSIEVRSPPTGRILILFLHLPKRSQQSFSVDFQPAILPAAFNPTIPTR